MKAKFVGIGAVALAVVVAVIAYAIGSAPSVIGGTGKTLPANTALFRPASGGQASMLYEAGQPSRGLQVTGVGVVRAKPDAATLTVGVQTRAATAQEAQSQNNQQMNAVLDALKAKGIAETDLQTTGLSLHPEYRGEQQEVTEFVATNNVQIRVADVGRVGELYDTAVAAGANQAGNIQFGFSNIDELRQQALAEAAEDARTRADGIAQAVGVTITGIESVVDQGGTQPIAMEASFAKAAADSVPIVPGEQEVRVQILIVYAIQ